jgi:hypothetical protein
VWRRNCRDHSGSELKFALPQLPDGLRPDRAALASADQPERLCPVKGSSLAADGAGKEDPLLPPYVGALPPEGVEPWDWDRTWRTRVRTEATK